jgi:hypothetical protein
MTNLFLGDSRLGCLSDTDDQLIVHIEFQEVVKVTFYLFKASISAIKVCFSRRALYHIDYLRYIPSK